MADILVVEDEPAIRDILREVLEIQGHRIDLASDGVEGRERVFTRGHPYDLIYSNYGMPRMDGVTFLKAIRPLVAFRVPRVLASGCDPATLVPLGLQTGTFDLLTYPFDVDDLRRMVAWGLRVGEAYHAIRSNIADAARVARTQSCASRRPKPSGRHRRPVRLGGDLGLSYADEVTFLHQLAVTTGTNSAVYRRDRPSEGLSPADSYEALLWSPIPHLRLLAARAVGRAPGGAQPALRVLTHAMRHRDPSVADEAIEGLQDLLATRH